MSSVRNLALLATVVGAAASILSVACADDGSTPGDPVIDSGADASDATADASTPTKDAGDPDARGPYDPADVPVVCDGSPCATQLVAGSDHFCARMSDGTVRCWGSDAFGVLGTIPEPDTGEPADPDAGADAASTVHVIADLSGVTQIGAAGATNCARLDDGTVKCWGDNRNAKLGIEIDPAVSDYDPHPTPSLVPLGSAASRVDVGLGSVCATLDSGKLWCWGKDDQGQLARDFDPAIPLRGPGLAVLDPTIARVANSDYTTLALSAEGQVWTWGASAGELGPVYGRVASISPILTPKRLESLDKVSTLVASAWIDPPFNPPPGPTPPEPPPRAHACALANGEVYCWGRSYAGALCNGTPDVAPEPMHALFPDTVKTWPQQLAVGDEITCARMMDGSVHCCGSDERGRLGTGRMVKMSPSFTKAYGFSHYAVQVATSDHAVCALVKDGSVECWGSNERGELGRTRDGADHPSPVKVVF